MSEGSAIIHSVDQTRTDEMSDHDFHAFTNLIHKQTGIVITPAKRSMLVSRLSRRLRQLGLKDFSSYRSLLENEQESYELQKLVSVITTNVTSFFREPKHFAELARLIPSFMDRATSGDRIRIWSAGCSSGEEPYSIAMTLKDNWSTCEKFDVRILATDIDPEMVSYARNGSYTRQQLGEAPSATLMRYGKICQSEDRYEISSAVKSLIRFEELNLLEQWPFTGKFDVIFCRNVVIYFDASTRNGLWERFAQRLFPGGTLFIGHSERVDAQLEPFLQPCGVTQYRRTDSPLD